MVIQTDTGLELRSSLTGTVSAEISTQLSWWKLASDGTYVCAGSASQLACWSPSGQTLFKESGHYANAVVFASPSALLVALGPAGANVIETVAVASWTSSVGPAFQGDFQSWFVDGSAFLTRAATYTVSVYSLATTLEGLVTLPSVSGLTGQGRFIWTTSPLTLYAVGNSATPIATYALSGLTPMGTLIVSIADNALTLIDLSGATPVETSYTLPIGSPNAFAAISPSQFMEGSSNGLVIDASTPGAPRTFDYGAVSGIAGSAARAVFTTASGSTFSYESASNTLQKTVDLTSSEQYFLSSDGSVLATLENGPGAANVTVDIYSMPGGTLINSFPYSTASAYPGSITISSGGTVLGELLVTTSVDPNGEPETNPAGAQTIPITGGSAIPYPADTAGLYLLDAHPPPMQISSDGTLVAVSSAIPAALYGNTFLLPPTTGIYQNGTLLTTVTGYATGWVQNGTLLVDNFSTCANGGPLEGVTCYAGAAVYTPTGIPLATPPLPETDSFQVVTGDLIFVFDSVVSATTATTTWASADPSTGGAFAGTEIVLVSGNLLLAQPY
jgi:hypothetical protein